MDTPLYDNDALRQTIGLTLNRDLYAKAQAAGVDVTRIVEEALIRALKAKQRDQEIKDIRRGSEATARYVEQHGDPVAEWYRMFESPDAA